MPNGCLIIQKTYINNAAHHEFLKGNIIITGGAGFIGNHVVRLFVNQYPDYHIINLDKLTYAGNLANLKTSKTGRTILSSKRTFCDFDKMSELIRQYHVDGIIHLAAESHVDRSIKDPFTFARTNVMGTLSLLQAAKEYWESLPGRLRGANATTFRPTKCTGHWN